MRFRKSIKIFKGLKINITSKGVSSVSVGGNGATLNTSRKGVRATASIPGSGLSHSQMLHRSQGSKSSSNTIRSNNSSRSVGFWLATGILIMPYIFAWLTLQQGYSVLSRVVSFLWMACSLLIISQ
jgi:hypothetical protein